MTESRNRQENEEEIHEEEQLLKPIVDKSSGTRRRRRSVTSNGILVLCICLILGVIGFLVFFLGKNLTPSPTPTPTPTPTPSPTRVDKMTLEILQYNVFGRPYQVSYDGQQERLARIPSSLATFSKEIDVVTFAEADIESERKQMLEQFKQQGFHYSTSILHDPDPFTSLVNGGVLIVTKWPILREAQHVYRQACHYSDCLAAKGVKYARILKKIHNTTKIFNIFATHMQAWSTPQGRDDRMKQAQQMYEFVTDLNLPYHEPLVFAGDFNVDNHTFAGEVAHLIELLHATAPIRVGSQEYTSDPHSNLLVGRDGAATSDLCFEQYVQSWGPLKDNTFHPNALTRLKCGKSNANKTNIFVQSNDMCYCPCCPSEWLDYVLYAKKPHQQPLKTPTLEAIVNQIKPFIVNWSAPHGKPNMELIDLSDHYPVLGRFEFAVNRTAGDDNATTHHLDGCATDDDCHFRGFRCYCNGTNCYYQGKQVNGWSLPSDHPVNRNCLYQKTTFKCLCGPT